MRGLMTLGPPAGERRRQGTEEGGETQGRDAVANDLPENEEGDDAGATCGGRKNVGEEGGKVQGRDVAVAVANDLEEHEEGEDVGATCEGEGRGREGTARGWGQGAGVDMLAALSIVRL